MIKTIAATILCSLIVLAAMGQKDSSLKGNSEEWRPVLLIKSKGPKKNETMTEFPGGRDSLFCFMENTWNQDLINKVDSGIISIRFEVEKSGEIRSIEINAINPFKSKRTKGFITIQNSKVKSEVLKAFENMPKWRPRMIGKRPKKSRSQSINLSFPYKKQCI